MPIEGLDMLVAEGQELLDAHDPADAHSRFNEWVREVTEWLKTSFPDSGLAADWAAQGYSNLIVAGGYHDDLMSWNLFRMMVQGRLRWLGHLPTKVKLIDLTTPARIQNEAKQMGRKEIRLHTTSRAYVDPDRVNQLKALAKPKYDITRLTRLCEELNVCFAGECYLAMIVLTRSILDHVPPIFDCKSFSEVANNYSGNKSFKEAMQRLESSSRKIADHYLHTQIRSSESLPNVTQVDFSNEIDFMLSEVVRVLKQP